ncbi:MAG: phospholipase effector Tle1 domain-containing protein, partial [Porticoccaceae bacterium]
LIARHALAIDELRSDFEPTIWQEREHMSLQQVWFAGVHSNIGGSYPADADGGLLSDIPLDWLRKEARAAGLQLEAHLAKALKPVATATVHQSRKHIFRSKRPYHRPIDHGRGPVLIHKSVRQRWQADANYRPKNLVDYLATRGGQWPALIG